MTWMVRGYVMMGGVAMGYTSQALLKHTWEKGEGVVE